MGKYTDHWANGTSTVDDICFKDISLNGAIYGCTRPPGHSGECEWSDPNMHRTPPRPAPLKVGDVDPEFAAGKTAYCNAPIGRFVCTRAKDHGSIHVASQGGGKIVAIEPGYEYRPEAVPILEQSKTSITATRPMPEAFSFKAYVAPPVASCSPVIDAKIAIRAYRLFCGIRFDHHPIAEQREVLAVLRELGKALGNEK